MKNYFLTAGLVASLVGIGSFSTPAFAQSVNIHSSISQTGSHSTNISSISVNATSNQTHWDGMRWNNNWQGWNDSWNWQQMWNNNWRWWNTQQSRYQHQHSDDGHGHKHMQYDWRW